MRESWTDDRLDYLNHKVEDGFKRVDERLDEVNRRMERLESQVEKLNDSFIEWSRSIALTNRALIVTVALGFLTILATNG